jgi:hypothetical protein
MYLCWKNKLNTMGSTGSGSFSDYHNYERNRNANAEGSNSNGGSSGEDQCARALSTSLDDVAYCEYYKTRRDLPPIGTILSIEFKTRLVAITDDGLSLGYLPTKYNYLRACMNDGFAYTGAVSSSNVSPIPSIIVDVAPKL